MLTLTPTHRAIVALILLHAMMTAAYLFQLPPHPPHATPLFGMGPFLGAVFAVAAAALFSGTGRAGKGLAVLTALLSLVSFGPHKWFDPSAHLIWPTLTVAQIAVGVILIEAVRGMSGQRAPAPA